MRGGLEFTMQESFIDHVRKCQEDEDSMVNSQNEDIQDQKN